ncbi:sulfurtransferase TusA family protein [Halomicrobium mukohataei]|uniref:SirA family protein n=2 Tax=Halomicrobium mukohataei TaxID=57705 RepID=C7P4Y0_HALMD|nr:sulfurtransferase TusA family protein [Halomicrobium mukohataei]ACV49375.1 SirA family protein [Halomicrobium mukohataei DSM 12286]QCD67206.1 sulfurtransferase TusA family protein [Halomicrobium mukohataei]
MSEPTIPDTAPDVEPEMTVDNRGRGCASGIARVQRALEDLPDGAVLVIRSTDRRAKREYPQLAAQTPHELLAIESERGRLLRKEYTTYLEIRRE